MATLSRLRPETDAAVLLTSDGRDALEARLAQLHVELAAMGPLLRDPEMERRLDDEYERTLLEARRLEQVLAEAVDLPPVTRPRTVVLGAVVEVERDDGSRASLRIVHPVEAALDDERVSCDAPVAAALLGRSVGDTVTVASPGGESRWRVTHIRAPRRRRRSG